MSDPLQISTRRLMYEPLESRLALCTACPGVLDTTFGGTGLVATDFLTPDQQSRADGAFAVAARSGGSLIAAGSSTILNPTGQTSFALASYDAAGELTSFGDSGTAQTDLGDAFSGAQDVVVQSDGKVVAVGQAPGAKPNPASQTDFAVVRYTASGDLDEDFGDGGVVLVDFFDLSENAGSFDRAFSVALDSQDRIIVAGQGGMTGLEFAVARLNPDGSLDTSFSGDGKFTRIFQTPAGVFEIVVQGDEILVAGADPNNNNNDIYVMRFLEDGTPDPDFGAAGLFEHTIPMTRLFVHSMGVDPNSGEIVLAGGIRDPNVQQFDVLLVRLHADGTLDTAFDGDGVLIAGDPGVDESAEVVIVQPDGRILTAGTWTDFTTSPFRGVLLNRFLEDGTADAEFGQGGRVIEGLGFSLPEAFDATLLPDGRLVVVGRAQSNFFAARFFATQGIVDIDSDQDGVSDQTENGAPNNGDGDNNGIPDRQENNVTSIPILGGSSYVTTVAPAGLALSNVGTPGTDSLTNTSSRTDAIGFEVTGLAAPGDAVPIEFIFAEPVDANALFKFSPTENDPMAHWHEFPFTTIDANADGDLLHIQFNLIDGGAGDADLVANGRIIDPSGLVLVSAGATIKGFTFADIDGDGLMTQAVTGEIRVGGWTVYLDDNRDGVLDWTDANANGVWDSGEGEQWTITDDDFGRYEFTGLDYRTYYVAQSPRPGWTPTEPPLFADAISSPGDFEGRGLAIGHVNPDEDLYPDVVVAHFFGTIIHFNNGDGTFAPRFISVAEGSLPEDVRIRDFNGDSLPDVAVVYTDDFDGPAEVRIFLNSGAGLFERPSIDDGTIIRVDGMASDNQFGTRPFQFVFGDVNGDGIEDFITDSTDTPSVAVSFGNGGGSFDPPVPIFLGESASGIALGNFDADAALELVVAQSQLQQVRIIDRPGVLNQTLDVVDLASRPGRIVVADLTFIPDGTDDIAVVLTDTQQVQLLLQTADHDVGSAAIIGNTQGDPRDIEAADFNGDGRIDLFVANNDDDSATALLREADGSFSEHVIGMGSLPNAVALGDVNGDGLLDVATANIGSSDFTVSYGNPHRHHIVRLGNNPLPDDVIFGNQPLFGGQIRGVAYQDDNADGQRQAGEPPIAGRTVYLDLNNNGMRDVATEPTDNSSLNGEYEFTNLAPGSYTIRVVSVPPLFLNTEPGAPGGQPGVPGSYTVTLGENQTISSGVDFGDAPPARLEGAVFYDTNGDSQRGTDEPPIVNWQVFLDENGNGMLDADELETRTEGGGRYSLEVIGGTYDVRQVVPEGWRHTSPPPPAGPVHTVTVAHAEIAADLHFANVGDTVVSGTVWQDINNDGVIGINALEPRQQGVTVYVGANANGSYDAADWQTVTNASGNYTLRLPPGEYRLGIVPPTGLNTTTPPTRVHDLTVTPLDVFSDLNFGVRDESNDITGIVWNDRTGDGRFGVSEIGAPGVVLYIDANDNGRQDVGEPTAVTGNQGRYRFANVAAGQHKVRLVQREPWMQTSPADLVFTEVDAGFPLEDSLAAVGSFNSNVDAFVDVAYVIDNSLGQDLVRTRLGTGPVRDFTTASEQTLAPLNADDFQDILYLTVTQANPQTDSFDDLIVVAQLSVDDEFRVLVFYGNGDGSFASPSVSTITTGYHHLTSGFVVGQFNPQTDAFPDLVNLEFDPTNPDSVKLFLGQIDSSGAFAFDDGGPRYSMEGPRSPLETNILDPAESLTVGDFTGDGILDLAAFNLFSDNLTFRAGIGDGTFGPRRHVRIFNTSASSRPAVADFDGDGDDDLVFVGREGGAIALSWMTSAGNLDFDQRIVSLPVPADFTRLASATVLPMDLDGDGRIDVVGKATQIANMELDPPRPSREFSFIYRNVGPATFRASIGTTGFVGFEAATLAAGLLGGSPTVLNLDGDSRDDVARGESIAFMEGFATLGIVVTPGGTADFGVVQLSDADNDGVSELTERSAPNGGDGNFDGLPDGSQAQVASLRNVLDGSYITIDAIAAGALLTDVQSTALPAPPPGGLGVPFGLVEFTLTNLSAGGAATIELYVHSPTLVTRYLKYGVEPDDPATLLVDESITPHWYDFAFDPATGIGATFEYNEAQQVSIITLNFVDGQRGDDDLTANGVIVDPGAPAIVAAALAGDFNGSGQVEQGDLDLVLLHWGDSAVPAPEGWVSDLPEGNIDQDELDAVLLNWGATSAASANAEPIVAPLVEAKGKSRPAIEVGRDPSTESPKSGRTDASRLDLLDDFWERILDDGDLGAGHFV